MVSDMDTEKVVARGPAAGRVAANVRSLREERRLTLDDVADRLRQLGHPISKSGLSKVETRMRRVDVDDLIALAVALETNPNRLLLGPEAEKEDEIELTPEFSVTSVSAWYWASGEASVGAGAWPWARFAQGGGRPKELYRFLEEVNPHSPPLQMTAEGWERIEPWQRRMTELWFEMHGEGLSLDEIHAVFRRAANKEFSFITPADSDE